MTPQEDTSAPCSASDRSSGHGRGSGGDRPAERKYADGGFIPGSGQTTVRIQRVGRCPNGHAQYRIDGSPHVEHIAPASDLAIAFCRYAVTYQPEDA